MLDLDELTRTPSIKLKAKDKNNPVANVNALNGYDNNKISNNHNNDKKKKVVKTQIHCPYWLCMGKCNRPFTHKPDQAYTGDLKNMRQMSISSMSNSLRSKLLVVGTLLSTPRHLLLRVIACQIFANRKSHYQEVD